MNRSTKTNLNHSECSDPAFAVQPSLRRSNPDLIKAIRAEADAERLSCNRALAIAEVLSCPPEQVGYHSDLLRIRINRCQLGLFGARSGPDPLQASPSIESALQKALQERAIQGRLPCVAVWTLAEQFGLSKVTLARLGERLGLKISQCQLGLF